MTYNREMTLLSFAMLKEKIDNNSSYIEYFEPYILHCITELKKKEPLIRDIAVQQNLKDIFGLNIPPKTINLMLQRISRKGFIQRTNKVYVTTDKFPIIDSNKIKNDINEFKCNVDKIIQSFISFSSEKFGIDYDEEKALSVLLSFFSKFGITCLDTFLNNSTIPEEFYNNVADKELIVIANYIDHVNSVDLEILHSLLSLLEGCLCANSLLCPELQNTSPKFKNVTFFFDVRPLLHILNLDGTENHDFMDQLVQIIRELDGKLAYFTHTLDELIEITQAIFYNENSYGSISEQLHIGTLTKSDLQLYTDREYVKSLLHNNHIDEIRMPQYEYKTGIKNSQIDETKLEEIIDAKLNYNRQEAKIRDIKSIRSIYALREKKRPRRIENCTAILVTHNKKLATCAREYKKYEDELEVTTVIDEFSLINLAWLKTPVDRAGITEKELLAQAYSMLMPSNEFINKILHTAQSMRDNGDVSLDEYLILRSDPRIIRDLYNMTLGEDKNLSDTSLQEALKRYAANVEKQAREEERQKTAKVISEKENIEKKYNEQEGSIKYIKNILNTVATIIAWIIQFLIFGFVSVCLFTIPKVEVYINQYIQNLYCKILAIAILATTLQFISQKMDLIQKFYLCVKLKIYNSLLKLLHLKDSPK